MCHQSLLSRWYTIVLPLLDPPKHTHPHCVHTHTHMRNTHTTHPTHTHTQLGHWGAGCGPADGLGATLSVTIVTCSRFPSSLRLSLPLQRQEKENGRQDSSTEGEIAYICIFLPFLECLRVIIHSLLNRTCVFLIQGLGGADDYVLLQMERKEMLG